MNHTATDPEILWGAAAIAEVINLNKRKTFYLLENRTIPARKVGGRYCASRTALLQYLRGEVRAAQ